MAAGALTPGAPALELADVGITYPGARRGHPGVEVVRDCSLRIERGQLAVMIGPSGAGKSTLVRLIAGFERPGRGKILIDGKPVKGPGPDRQVMFQETALFPWMTTRGNVLYGPEARGQRSPRIRERALALLDKVGLAAFRDKYPLQLSGGMQRRAELARAMMNEPALMILDEPFRGLDAMTKKLMLDYYARLTAETGRTDLFVTTDVDEAVFLADRLFVMTHIPTRVRAVIDVDIPRPRDLAALLADERANRIKMDVLSLLHEEASRSFAAGRGQTAADFVAAYRRALTPSDPAGAAAASSAAERTSGIGFSR